MSANIGQIVAEITANTTGLRRGAADAKKILNDTSNNASVAGKVIGVAFAITASLGVVKLIDKLEDCTQVAIDNKKALMGLESVAKAYGVSADDAKKATKDFTQDGLIQMKSAITGMKNILSTNFSVSEAMNLSQALKDIGAFNSTTDDLGTAFEDATKGMRTGSIELIENIGLTQKLSAVMKNAEEQAKASGDTEKARQLDVSNGIDLTNNAAQREAFYNMVLKEGEKFKGNAAKLADDQASSQAKANAAMKEAADAIGNKLLPAYSNLMGAVNDISKSIAGIFSEDRIDKANKYAKAVNEQKTDFLVLAGVYEQLATKTNKSAEEMKLYRDTIAEMKKLYPDYLDNLDMEKGKYEDVAKAIDRVNEKLALKAIYAKKEQAISPLYEKMATAQVKIQEITTETETDIARWKSQGLGYLPAAFGDKITFDQYRKEKQIRIDKYRAEIKDYQKQIDNINKLYAPILGGYDAKQEDKSKADAEAKAAAAKKKAEEAAKKNAEGAGAAKKSKKETFSLDTSETTQQKLIEQNNKYKVDLANAKEEEKWRVELENKKAVAIINATAEAEKKIAAIRNKVESGNLSESAGKKQAQAINEQLAKDIGEIELSITTKEKNVDYAKNALGLTQLENYGIIIPISGDITQIENELQRVADNYMKEINKQGSAVGLTDMSNYGVTARTRDDEIADENRVKSDYVNKSLDDVTKSFSELAGVLDNEVISAISNVANAAMSMNSNIKGFSAAQGAEDTLGMLSSGIGIFSSAVSIFQSVGGLFHKSTYNFDEAVKKMLAGIGEKTPELQSSSYKAAVEMKTLLEMFGKNTQNVDNTVLWTQGGTEQQKTQMQDVQKSLAETFDVKKIQLIAGALEEQFAYIDKTTGQVIAMITTKGNEMKIEFDNGAAELLANLEKIIPQLAEQLGTAAGDFGSAIGSALSSATTSEELKANLYDSIYGTVKSGLINAFLAGEVMKPLLDNLQQTVTLAVADGIMSPEEKAAIQALMGDVGIKTDEFYSALEAVGLNVVDAAGQLNQAADRMDNVNRNLRLADRISTITTQTNTAGITQLAGSSSIVYDFSNANLGGMTEQQVISAVSKANRMASIRKVGV